MEQHSRLPIDWTMRTACKARLHDDDHTYVAAFEIALREWLNTIPYMHVFETNAPTIASFMLRFLYEFPLQININKNLNV